MKFLKEDSNAYQYKGYTVIQTSSGYRIKDGNNNWVSGEFDTDVDAHEHIDDLQESFESSYKYVESKPVLDSDGFYTDYTWYKSEDGLNVFVFGDKDIYQPEDGDFDFETENNEEAQNWFDSYNGFEEDFIEESWRSPKYDESEWEPEDIELHKSIDWKARNYEDYPVMDDTITARAIAYGLPGGPQYKETKFVKHLRANEIYPPYYKAEKIPFEGVLSGMYDGDKYGKYMIMNRFETQDVYDALSEETHVDHDVSESNNNELWDKGDEVTLWWINPKWSKTSPSYADCIYDGRNKEGKYRFISITYGWAFLLDIESMTITTPQGKVYPVFNDSGWLKTNASELSESVEEGFHIGDKVKQKWADPYNVGEVIDTKYDPRDGNMIQVKWYYSEGPDVEWLNADEVSSYNEADEKAGYYEDFESMNTYTVTFYMASLDDQMPDGPTTTKTVYAASEKDAEKKLMDSSTDKYYIPTIVKVEQINEKLIENTDSISYESKECSYEIASEIAQAAKRALRLPANEVEMLEHDINNLRSYEWVDSFAALSDKSRAKQLFFQYAVKEVSYDEESFDEAIEMTADEMKAKHGTDDPDIINAGKPEEERVALNDSWLTAKPYSVGIGMRTLANKLERSVSTAVSNDQIYTDGEVKVDYTHSTDSRSYLTSSKYQITVRDTADDHVFLRITAKTSADSESYTVEMSPSHGKVEVVATPDSFIDLIQTLYEFGVDNFDEYHILDNIDFKSVRDMYAGDWKSWIFK